MIALLLQPLTVEYIQPSYYVEWFTLALLNAGIAQGKGRGGLVWFLISIFFGPLATLVLVLLPKV